MNVVKHFKWEARGKRRIDSSLAPLVTATIHPSSILRARDGSARGIAMKELVADLSLVADELR